MKKINFKINLEYNLLLLRTQIIQTIFFNLRVISTNNLL